MSPTRAMAVMVVEPLRRPEFPTIPRGTRAADLRGACGTIAGMGAPGRPPSDQAAPELAVGAPAGSGTPDLSADPADLASGSAGAAPNPGLPEERVTPPRFRLGNRPPLTGLRALAVAAVLVYHSNFRSLPGSWAALQVFFVLSGFLITAMLAGEGRRKGRISMKGFYGRRAVRLVPPLLLTIGLLALYAAFVHVADAAQRLWGDSFAAMFYYADYRQAFGHAPFFGYLAQTWSLSVEEQFYVVWSLLMVAAVATHRLRLAYVFAIGGLALSVADRLWWVYHVHQLTPMAFSKVFDRVYYAFDTRADALFLGCLLGLIAADGYLERWPRWARSVLTASALASAAFLAWVLLYAQLFTRSLVVWGLPATAVASAVIVAYFVISPKGIGSRLVGIGLLVFIGDISYTVYLVHFPVYLALQPSETGWGFWPTEVVRLAVVFAIAVASWFCLERPLMRWRQRSAAR